MNIIVNLYTKIIQKKDKKTKRSFYIFLFVSLLMKKPEESMKTLWDSAVWERVKLNCKPVPIFQANNFDFCCGVNKAIIVGCKESGYQKINKIKIINKWKS
jgi:hypothetical protein